MSIITSIIEAAEQISRDYDAIFLSTGTQPFMRARDRGEAIPVDAIRQITNQDVLAAYQEFQSDTNIKVLSAARKTDRRGALAVSVRGKGRYRVDWYHQRSSLSMTIRPVPFDKGPWLALWPFDQLREAYRNRILPRLSQGELLWVTSEHALLAHQFTNALTDECSAANRFAKVVRIDEPARHLHRSSENCLIEQIEVGVDCESLMDATRAIATSAADGVIMDVSWADSIRVQAAIDGLRDEGMWVIAWAPTRHVKETSPRIVVGANSIEVTP